MRKLKNLVLFFLRPGTLNVQDLSFLNKLQVQLSRWVSVLPLERNEPNNMYKKKRFVNETEIRRTGVQISAWRALSRKQEERVRGG